MTLVTNAAAYQFATLDDLKPLRERLLRDCKTYALKGTILLAPEGVNLFVAGPRDGVDRLLIQLRALPGLEGLTAKFSESDHQPFTRMLVRIKQEIIAFGMPGINPAKRTSPKLEPRELKRWLDEGRPMTLLDTRNDYEVRLGTFENAAPIGITHFREFPQAVLKLPPELKQQPIVMFCTGGIRCEKAGPYMEQQGFEQVYQLAGGILKYFEDCGGEHYRGECFVFDQRVGVDPALRESSNTQCFACLTPLTVEEQNDPRYVPGKTCPYCHRTADEERAATIEARHATIRRVTSPLPGSGPYLNERPLSIPGRLDRATLLEALVDIFPQVSREAWWDACASGRLCDVENRPVAAETVVRSGQRFRHRQVVEREPDVNADIRILHEDDALVVLHKPAPLPMHPCGRFHRNTLQAILAEVYAPLCPKPAHRLDALTTGVVVAARTRHFARMVQPQFERGQVEKVYLARVQGHPVADEFACDAPIPMSPAVPGAAMDPEAGLAARTEFRVMQRAADGTALLEVRPLTGRTNQIRLHLGDAGWPIVGDPLYLPGARVADETATLCLHAWKITLTHPQTRERVTYVAPPEAWCNSAG